MNPQAITHVVEHVRDVFIGKLFDDITCGFLTGVTRLLRLWWESNDQPLRIGSGTGI